jgi:hypothetical protein
MSVKQVFNTSAELDYPTVLPTLDLDFANSKTLDPRITFTRASGGSYVGADGLIKYAGVNEARFDHNPSTGESLGLLVEEARTNLVIYSEDFSTGWGYIRLSYSENQITSPDGNVTADKLIEDTTENTTHRVQSTSITFTSGTTYTHSVFAKSGERSYLAVELHFQNSGNVWGESSPRAWFDLATGTIGDENNCTATITNFGNGWYRCSITQTASSTGVNSPGYKLATGTTSGDEVYTGNGTSGIFVWGAQVEQGSFPTSYIPTVASTVTRSADNASITGTNFSSFYNPSEGSILCNGRIIKMNPSTFGQIFWAIGDSATFNESMYLVNDASTNNITYNLFDNGSNQFQTKISNVTDNSFNKTAIAIKLNDSAGSFNGSTPTTDTSCTLPTVNSLKIGNASWNTLNSLNGTIARLTYYPVRLSNSQLQTLTK